MNDVFRCAERDVCYASDVPFGRDVCLRHVGGTHHITATVGSIITCAAYGKYITCTVGANITVQTYSFYDTINKNNDKEAMCYV